MRISRGIMGALVAAMLAPGAAGQGVIELRSSARAEPGAAVRLADIARLDGPDAAALADLEVLPSQGVKGATRSVDVEHLRELIDGSGRGVNWGRLVLRGQRCTVLAGEETPRVERAERAPKAQDTAITAGTLREAILVRVAQAAGVEARRVRLTFDERDREALDMPTRGRTVEVNVAGMSDRLPLAISMYEGERTVLSRTIRVRAEVLRPAFRATRAVARGATIGSEDLEAIEDWMALTARPAGGEEAIGASAQGPIRAGAIVMAADVAPAVAVQRGEVVSVRVVSGSVVVSTKGRAMARAREGELVRLQALDSPREFVARMDGRQRAVVVAGVTPGAEDGLASRDERARGARKGSVR